MAENRKISELVELVTSAPSDLAILRVTQAPLVLGRQDIRVTQVRVLRGTQVTLALEILQGILAILVIQDMVQQVLLAIQDRKVQVLQATLVIRAILVRVTLLATLVIRGTLELQALLDTLDLLM